MAFITFEGTDGTGKTTQIKLLAERLQAAGYRVLRTREPGGCAIADQIRSILLHPENNALVPAAELLLYAAARAQHVEEVIRPALQQGTIVLCDRFTDATFAYQGGGRGLSLPLIESLNQIAAAGVTPDLTLLFDLKDVSTGLKRTLDRSQTCAASQAEGRLEQESLAFHLRVRDTYRSLAQQEQRFRLINADRSPEVIADEIALLTLAFLRGQNP